MINIKIDDAKFKRWAKDTEKKIPSQIASGLKKAAILIQVGAAKKAPKFTGNLRKSIQHKLKRGTNPTAVVGAGVHYAKYVEFGTKPHYVSFKTAPGLKTWLVRKGVIPADSKRTSFFVSGQEQPFFFPTVAEVVPNLDNIIAKEVKL